MSRWTVPTDPETRVALSSPIDGRCYHRPGFWSNGGTHCVNWMPVTVVSLGDVLARTDRFKRRPCGRCYYT